MPGAKDVESGPRSEPPEAPSMNSGRVVFARSCHRPGTSLMPERTSLASIGRPEALLHSPEDIFLVLTKPSLVSE
jgi:hypothetical protein